MAIEENKQNVVVAQQQAEDAEKIREERKKSLKEIKTSLRLLNENRFVFI
jgi:hypothetical protein